MRHAVRAIRERRNRTRLAFAAAAMLASALLLSGCGGRGTPEPVRSPDSVQWAGDDEWIVATYLAEDGAPTVVAVDAKTHEARVEHGFTIAAVESTGAVIWLVPTSAEEWRALAAGERAWSGDIPIDAPPERLVAWDLARDSGPSDAVPAKWERLSGPGVWVAYLEIDILRGSRPSRLLFMDSSHRDDGHTATLPPDFGTFRPVGWSSSGHYFAVEELVLVSGESGLTAAEVADTALSARRVLVVEPATGAVVASATVGPSTVSSVEWLGYEDSLIWLTAGSEIGTGTAAGAMRLRAAGPATPDAYPLDFETADSGFIAEDLFGVGDPGVMLRASDGDNDEIWLLDRIGPVRVVRVGGAASLAPSSKAGVAVLRFEKSNGRSVPVLSLAYGPSSPSEGQTEVEIWRE